MKIFFIIILLNSAFCFSQKAEFSFKKVSHKFPKTKAGKELVHYYVFKNKGNAPLTINSYEVACPCTKIDFPTYPILPGKTDSIKLTFDSKGKFGQQDRSIILSSNVKRKETILNFRVYVIKD
ncbi:MAG: DUF1573 domain-containing protein [Bacteroidota bacterium]